MLLVIGSIHQALVRRGLRTYVSLICETGSAWDVHQIALLLGYGAEAVVPTLALAAVRALAGERRLEHLTGEQAAEMYVRIIEGGLRKVMARMGISTVRNIIGAGLFEVLGLEASLIERCFASSAAHPGTISLTQIAGQEIERAGRIEPEQPPIEESRQASGRRRKLVDVGRFRFRRDAVRCLPQRIDFP